MYIFTVFLPYTIRHNKIFIAVRYKNEYFIMAYFINLIFQFSVEQNNGILSYHQHF